MSNYVTIAELFNDYWDLDFKQLYITAKVKDSGVNYAVNQCPSPPQDLDFSKLCIQDSKVRSSQSVNKYPSPSRPSSWSALAIPPCHLPHYRNNFSVSNYVVESLYAALSTHGEETFFIELHRLMTLIPTIQREVVRSGILKRLGSLQRKRDRLPLCAFCKSAGRPESVYRSHTVKSVYGAVVCPYLREYTCPLCNASGDDAHTIRYCPCRSLSSSHFQL